MIYSALIQDAVRFAAAVHAKQTRKGKDTPYITHLLCVALILARAGADEDVVVAGVLHDAIEDSSKENKVTKEILAEKFGGRVADLVDAVTEQNKELPWAERKQIALEHIKDMDHDALLLKSADVLHNLSDLIHDVEQEGEAVFKKFNAPKEKQIDRYLNLQAELENAWSDNPLLKEIKLGVGRLYMLVTGKTIDDLKPGPRHHRKFSGEILEMLDRLRVVFQDVYPRTIDEWVDGFDRDQHPEQEIATWLHMADVFEKVMEQFPDEQKHDVFLVLLLYSSGLRTRSDIRSHTNKEKQPLKLSDDEIELVIKHWTL